MEPISTILSAAVGYILKGAANSKTGQNAKEELLEGFWAWARPLFIEDIPDIEKPTDPEATEENVSRKLLQLVEGDEGFFEELAERVNTLKKADVKEKILLERTSNG